MKSKEIILRLERRHSHSFLLREKECECRSLRRMRGHGTAHPKTSNLTAAPRARGVIPRGVKIKPSEASCSPKEKILVRRTGRNCGLCRLSMGRVALRHPASFPSALKLPAFLHWNSWNNNTVLDRKYPSRYPAYSA